MFFSCAVNNIYLAYIQNILNIFNFFPLKSLQSYITHRHTLGSLSLLFNDLLPRIMVFWFSDTGILHYCNVMSNEIKREIMSNCSLDTRFHSLSLQFTCFFCCFFYLPCQGRATTKWPKLDIVKCLVLYCFCLIRQSNLNSFTSDIVFSLNFNLPRSRWSRTATETAIWLPKQQLQMRFYY